MSSVLRSVAPAVAGAPIRIVSRCGWPLGGELNVDGLRSLVAVLGVVGDLCPLGERAVAIAGDAGVVDEEVLGLVVGCDEPEALVVAEPLDGSGSHCVPPAGVRAADAEIAEEQKLRALALGESGEAPDGDVDDVSSDASQTVGPVSAAPPRC